MAVQVFIHTGMLSINNGVVAPLKNFFELAKAVDGEVIAGPYHGSDMLSVPEKNWPEAEALLVDAKFLYRPVPKPGQPDGPWLNQQTERVIELLKYQVF